MFAVKDAGRAVELRPGGLACALQAEQCAGCEPEPELVSVVLTRRDGSPDVDPTNTLVRVIAVVEWGCGGISEVFEVDWTNGRTFTLTAERVTVNARYDGEDRGPWTPMQVCQAALVLGTRPASGSPRLTVTLGSLAPAASVLVPIPPGASSVSLLSDFDTGYGRYLCEVLAAPAGNVRVRYSPGSPEQRLPFPVEARMLRVVNNRGGGPDLLTALFYLDV